VYKKPFFNEESWRIHSPLGSTYNSIVTLKYYIFNDEFKKWDTVVYSDADVIIRGDISGALNSKEYFSSVLDVTFSIRFQYKDSIKLGNEYDLSAPSFCSGFFVLKPKIGNTDFCKLEKLHTKYGELCLFADQGILNLYFYKTWKKISLVYDMPFNMLAYLVPFFKSLIESPVLHVYGTHKPWLKHHFLYKEWQSYLLSSEDIDFKPDKQRPEGKKLNVYKIILSKLIFYIAGNLIRIIISVKEFRLTLSF
jgi:lipopolysaccharide biosynthesis glycosyltransferase